MLTDNDSHIEHFQPQSDTTVDPLDYNNMICSCQNAATRGMPMHCGVLKGDWFDTNLLISPFSPTCEQHFSFDANGMIKPCEPNNVPAAETIKKLGLDIPKLNALRAKAIEPFLDQELTEEDLRKFTTTYLKRDPNGHFQPFWTTIKILFNHYTI